MIEDPTTAEYGLLFETLQRKMEDYSVNIEDDLAILLRSVCEAGELGQKFMLQVVLPQMPIVAMEIAVHCHYARPIVEHVIKLALPRAGGAQLNYLARNLIATVGLVEGLQFVREAFPNQPEYLELIVYYLQAALADQRHQENQLLHQFCAEHHISSRFA